MGEKVISDFFDRDYTRREAYSRAWAYIRPYKWRLVVGILCGFLTAGTLVPMFQLVKPVTKAVETKVEEVVKVDEVEAGTGTSVPDDQPKELRKISKYAAKLGIKAFDEKGRMAGGVLFLILTVVPIVAFVRLALKFLNTYMLSWVGVHSSMDLSADLLKHVQRQSLEFHGRVEVGRLITRISGDTKNIRTIVQSVIADLAEAPFEIAVSIGYVIWYAIYNHMVPTLVLLGVAFPLFVLPIKILSTKIKKWARKSMMRASMVLSRIHEILSCMKLVKSTDMQDYEVKRYAHENRNMVKAQLRLQRLGGLVTPAMEFLGVILICAFVAWCFWKNITLDAVLPMLAPLLVIYKPVKKLSRLQVVVEKSMASLSRIFSLLDVHMEIPEAARPIAKPTFDKEIKFDDVSFRYQTQDHDSVSHASFTLGKGKKVAVVGTTGSGKSTMSSLLARFADPTSGAITMDGIDLRNIAQADLRKLIGVVTQETLLFNETIDYNIRYGVAGLGSGHSCPRVSEAQIESAAKLANAHDFIVANPEGYQKLCGDNGYALSGGERQRISIACAILKNPPILILDEATSALDTVTERLVQDALEKLMQNRTTFVIAHRLSTVRDADMILVMQEGRIVERGTHDELYAKGGVYTNLCNMQKTNG